MVRGTTADTARQENDPLRRWLVPLYLLVPLMCSAATSVLITPNYAAGRTDQLVFPAYCLLLGAGISGLPHRFLKLAGGSLLLVFAIVTLLPYYSQIYPRTDRDWSEDLARRLQEGDVVVCTSLTRTTTEYYLRRAGKSPRIFSYPSESADHLGFQSETELLARPGYLQDEAQTLLTRLRATCEPGDRIFLLLAGDWQLEPLQLVPIAVNQPLVEQLRMAPYLDTQEPWEPFQQRGINYGVVLVTLSFHQAESAATR